MDDPAAKAELLRKQLRHFQPEGRYEKSELEGPHHRLLSGIRGVRLSVVEALAKFKFDDHKPEAMRLFINDRLRQRGGLRDQSAASEQLRRLDRKRG